MFERKNTQSVQSVTYEVGSCAVDAESTNVLTSHPHSPDGREFYPTWLVVEALEGDLEEILITDVKVGPNSQLWSMRALPASLFGPTARTQVLKLDSMAEGRRLRVDFANGGATKALLRVRVVGQYEAPAGGQGLVGLGSTRVDGTANILVAPQLIMQPSRLFFSPRMLEVLSVDEVSNGPYLDVESYSRVPPEQLQLQNLRGSGEICFKPCSRIGRGVYLTIEVHNLTSSPQYFTGAVIARLP